MNTRKISINILCFVFILIPFFVFSEGSSGGLVNPLDDMTVQQFVSKMLGYIVKIGGVLATIAIVYVGFLFASAGGDAGKIKTARSVLINTLLGLAVLLGAEILGATITSTINSIK
jgi:hypothetical protein